MYIRHNEKPMSAIYKCGTREDEYISVTKIASACSSRASRAAVTLYTSLRPIVLHGSSRRGESAHSININAEHVNTYVHMYIRIRGTARPRAHKIQRATNVLFWEPYRTIIFRSVRACRGGL